MHQDSLMQKSFLRQSFKDGHSIQCKIVIMLHFLLGFVKRREILFVRFSLLKNFISESQSSKMEMGEERYCGEDQENSHRQIQATHFRYMKNIKAVYHRIWQWRYSGSMLGDVLDSTASM